MKQIAIWCILVVATGCATVPVGMDEAVPVAADRVFKFQEPLDGYGMVVVTRDKGVAGSVCNTNIFINGEHAASIAPGEKAVFWLMPGNVIIGAEAAGLCSGGLTEVEANVIKNSAVYFRVGFDHQGIMGLYKTFKR